MQRALGGVALVVQLIRTADVTIELLGVFLRDFDFILIPTLERPRLGAHTRRLHAELDLPRIFKSPRTTDGDGHGLNFRMENFPNTVQSALSRGIEAHSHDGSQEHVVRLTLLDGWIDED